jgi:2-isopropylmalate synthase
MKTIKIFDTTLRDGEQCPGASLNVEEKFEIAKQLARLNVDIIEAGFAIASPGDFESVKRIAQSVKGPIICSLSRAKKEDIQAAWDAVKHSDKPRIHTFIATSPIHMEKKLGMTPAEVLDTAVRMVRFAKSLCPDVEFSCEDAGRSELDYLYKIIAAVIEAGATTVNIPDTVGYTIPAEFGKLIKNCIENIPALKNIDVSVHCHNDLGLAVANSLAAIVSGVTQVECTINGIGERAGNCSLEEIVMSLKTRHNYFNADTRINTEEIYKTSRLVSNLTGMLVQPNKAIVGRNAFAHEAGIHQAGVIKAPETYEIMTPQSIGLTKSELVLGKHSGRNAFVKRLCELGYDNLSKEEIEKAFQKFKVLADKKKEVSDKDLESLVSEELYEETLQEIFVLKSVKIIAGTKVKPSAEVVLLKNKKQIKVKVNGVGPVDAIYKAITQATKVKVKLVDYTIQAITGGTDAIGNVTIRIEQNGNIFSGHGGDTDILVASAKAYVNAVNKLLNASDKKNKIKVEKKGM